MEVEWNTTQNKRMLTIYKYNGSSGVILATTPLPGGNATTLDLRMDVTPSTYSTVDANGNVTATYGPYADLYYAVNGGSFTQLPIGTGVSSVAAGDKVTTTDSKVHAAVPDNWITSSTPAGIITSHQAGGTAFSAVYENFVISRR